MDNFKIRSVFALGPAPPGYRPPDTTFFIRLESRLMTMSRSMKDTTARIDRLRGFHRIETCTSMRRTIKENVMRLIKDQVQNKERMAKYSLKLKALQEAEILKVSKHMYAIDKICQEKSNRLAHLKVISKQESDPAKVRSYQQDIIVLGKEQERARDLHARWKLRLEQMEDAKVKMPPTSNQSVTVSKNISTPKPKTDTKANNKVATENIKNKVSPPKPTKDTKSINKKVPENIKKISTPKPNTGTEGINKVVSENINSKISTPKPKVDTKCIPKTVALKSKEKINAKDCKRCAFLQRTNKNKKNLPKICNICLKWAHRVLQDGAEVIPNKNITISSSSISETVLMQESDLNTDFESTIKVEIEPVTDIMMQECVTQMDSPTSSIEIEIEPLDASMNDEIMSDVIKEDEAENLTKMDSIDFEEVISIQDGLKTINDKTTALAHVRILQEYAMLNDNYRAIGLLSEVEAALINPAKSEDFEC